MIGAALYHPAAYDTARPIGSLWAETAGPGPDFPVLEGGAEADVAILGGGFTGLSAALHLARDHGLGAAVVEAGPVGWGASGRNGGFCGLGGAKLSQAEIAARHGLDEAKRFFALKRASVERVRGLLADEAIRADAGPDGEVELAHAPGAFAGFAAAAAESLAVYGYRQEVLPPDALRERGLQAAGVHGGLLQSEGFGLHPLKYVRGLAQAAWRRGARIFEHSPVRAWRREGGGHVLETERGRLRAGRVIVATAGYTPEGLDPRLRGRVLPALSNILTTRPLTAAERAAQGWTAETLAFDSRILLHYFRLLPDGRFLFGGRGGLSAAPGAEAAYRRRLERAFRRAFPAWAGVETTHFWRGFVDLAADRLPHCAAFADDPTAFHGLAYHGSGVALGTEVGAQLAALAAGRPTGALPAFMARPAPRFPLPGLRLAYLAGAYAGFGLRDRMG